MDTRFILVSLANKFQNVSWVLQDITFRNICSLSLQVGNSFPLFHSIFCNLLFCFISNFYKLLNETSPHSVTIKIRMDGLP